MSFTARTSHRAEVPWWHPVLFAAMAGGLGWGIRGQYGHETGAMIAGVLVCLTLVFLLCPGLSTLQVVRAAALGAVAMGIGGTETYGVTLGLTHNPELVGNWESLRWGMLGCLVKGALWIGFAGLFLGIGLGGKRYSPGEMLLVGLGMIVAYFFGTWLLNSPFDIEARRLPAISFSNVWIWAPESASEPRREAWGGLLFAIAFALAYVALWKRDALARNMGLWGVIGGGLGFPLGQSLQAFHAWNPELFKRGLWETLDRHMNWWNHMETTFGFIMGAALGLGLWLNRSRIDVAPDPNEKTIPVRLEWLLLALHCYLLLHVQLGGGLVSAFYDSGLFLALLPFVCNIRGRIWPWFQLTTVTLLPICVKTVRELVFDNETIAPGAGVTLYLVLPLVVASSVAAWYAMGGRARRTSVVDAPHAGVSSSSNRALDRQDDVSRANVGIPFVPFALLMNVLIYFGLNYAFFRFPLPWADWTGRTPNGIVFTLFAFGLTCMVLCCRCRRSNVDAPAVK